MATINSLAQSIRAALAAQPAAPEVKIDELRALAVRAKAVNEAAITFLSGLPPVQTEHHYIALQLIRAAIDHGRGLLFLLESNPMDMGGPAVALHRSQIENFLRGVFLGFLASEEQVTDFLENDAGIRERNHNNRWQNIGVVSLAQRVEALINELSDEPLAQPNKFSTMVANAWSPLCGFVHGGRAIHAMYVDGQGQIGGDIPIPALVQVVSNSFVVTNFAFLVVIAHIHNLEGVPLDSPLHNAMQEFIQLHRQLRVGEL